MRIIVGLIGTLLTLVILGDAFETVVLPRRVSRRIRLARMFYRTTWGPWAGMAGHLRAGRRRENWLSYFGPLSLLLLISVWALGLICSFGLLQWASMGPGVERGIRADIYFSASTFFTLGIGDVVPLTHLARFLTVVEAGTGLGFLALVIGYLPVLYQSFSRREVAIVLLDARAGSPPTAMELLRRHGWSATGEASCAISFDEVEELLKEWERWAADLLESHISYPVLGYFRSQHNHQSWLAALTAILDTCALTMATAENRCARQARLTFAISRHAVVDLVQIFGLAPRALQADRLNGRQWEQMQLGLREAGWSLQLDDGARGRLELLRERYEPYVAALAEHFLLDVPPWIGPRRADAWQSSAWDRPSPSPGGGPAGSSEVHF